MSRGRTAGTWLVSAPQRVTRSCCMNQVLVHCSGRAARSFRGSRRHAGRDDAAEACFAFRRLQQVAVMTLEIAYSCVVPRAGHAVVPANLRDDLARALGPSGCPEPIVTLESIPRTRVGKVDFAGLKRKI